VKLKFKLRLRRLQRRSATAQYEYANAGQFAVELRNRFAALAIPEAEEPGNSIQTPDTGNHSCAQISCGDGAQQKQTKMSGQSKRRWISLRDTILDTAKETLTTKRRTYSPWISGDTLAAIEAKRMCKRRSEDYPALKRTVKKMVKADRTAYFESICEMARAELTNRSDHVYKCVERLTKQACPKTRLVRSGTGEMLTDDVSILGRWRDYCEDLYSTPASERATGVSQWAPNTSEGAAEGFRWDRSEPAPSIGEIEKALKSGRTR